jgi:hypothetical protein
MPRLYYFSVHKIKYLKSFIIKHNIYKFVFNIEIHKYFNKITQYD